MRQSNKPEYEVSDECDVDERMFFAQLSQGSDFVKLRFTERKGQSGLRAHKITIQKHLYALVRTRKDLDGGVALMHLLPTKAASVFQVDDSNAWIGRIDDEGILTFNFGFVSLWKDGRVILKTDQESGVERPGPFMFRGARFGFNLCTEPWEYLELLEE